MVQHRRRQSSSYGTFMYSKEYNFLILLANLIIFPATFFILFYLCSFSSPLSLNHFIYASFLFLTAPAILTFHQRVLCNYLVDVFPQISSPTFTTVSLNSFHSSSTVPISCLGIFPFILFLELFSRFPVF